MPTPNEADQDRMRWLFLQSQGAAGAADPGAPPPPPPAAPAATPSSRLQERLDAFGRGEPVLGVSAGERATQDLIGQGVRTDLSMSPAERYTASLGIEDTDAAQRVLNQRPGGLNRQITGGITVARDPASGHLIATDPSQPAGQQRFFVNRPGADLGDLTGAVPDIGVAAYGATAGALTGLAVGGATASPMAGVAAGAVAEAIASSAARYDVFRRGQQAGAVDPQLGPLDLWQRTLPEAALNGLMSLGVGTAYRVFRAVAGRHAPEMTLEEFERRLAQARGETAVVRDPNPLPPLGPQGEITLERLRGIVGNDNLPQTVIDALHAGRMDEVNAYLRMLGRDRVGVIDAVQPRPITMQGVNPRPENVDPTSAQVLAGTPAGDLLAQQQRQLARQPGPSGTALRERLDAQARGVIGAEERLAADTLPGVDRAATTPWEAGAQIRGQAAREHDDLLGQVRAAANQTVAGAEERAATGETLRDAFGRAQTRLGENADAAFGAIRREVGDVEGVPEATIAFARARGAGMDAQVVPNLNAAERRLVNGILERNAAEGEAPRAVTYGQVSDDIAELNRLIRRTSRGQGTGEAHPEIETLTGLRDALMRDREGILRAAGRDDALAQLREVSGWYRGENDRLTRGIVEEITRTRAAGSYDVIPDEQVARRLLARRADAQLVAELAADPQYAQQLAPVMGAMRSALREEWRQAAIDPATRMINPAGHARFMEQNANRLGVFFTPEEAAQFAQPAALAARLERQDATWRALIGDLRTDPVNGQMLRDVAPTPDGVFRHVWGTSPDPGIVRGVVGALQQSGNQEALATFRGAILRDVRESVLQDAGQTGIGRAQIDPARISAYVRSHGEALTEALGRDYVTGLRQVATAAERYAMGSREVSPGAKRTALYWLSRIVFAPFSTAGRLMTAGVRTGESAEATALGRVLLDPEQMRRAVQMRNVTAREAVDWAIAGGLIGDAVEASR